MLISRCHKVQSVSIQVKLFDNQQPHVEIHTHARTRTHTNPPTHTHSLSLPPSLSLSRIARRGESLETTRKTRVGLVTHKQIINMKQILHKADCDPLNVFRTPAVNLVSNSFLISYYAIAYSPRFLCVDHAIIIILLKDKCILFIIV